MAGSAEHAGRLEGRTALARLEAGNASSLKGVGQGVHELRIDIGRGHRLHLGLDGAELVILVGGSTKARQAAAIAEAQVAWKAYRALKRKGE